MSWYHLVKSKMNTIRVTRVPFWALGKKKNYNHPHHFYMGVPHQDLAVGNAYALPELSKYRQLPSTLTMGPPISVQNSQKGWTN